MRALTFEQGAAVASVIEAMKPWRRSLLINSCIEQVRMLCEVLPAFGLAVRPLQVDLLVTFHKQEAIFAAVSEEMRQEFERRGKQPVVDDSSRKGGFLGHMVAIVEDQVLIDPTIGQAYVPETDVHLDIDVHVLRSEEPLVVEPDFCIEQDLTTEKGLEVTLLWRVPRRQEFEELAAWGPDDPRIVRAIVWRARRILEEGLAARAAKGATA